MKKTAILGLILTATVCLAATPSGNISPQQPQPRPTQPVAECNSYSSCVEQGLSERNEGKDSVLLYYSEGDKDIRYKLFDNISIKFGSNICPPIVNVYKTVNSINYLLNTFSKETEGGCIKYYSNITGDGRDRDAVVGQLEVMFCNQDELFETCENGVIYSKINNFNRLKAKEQPQIQNNIPLQNLDGTYNKDMQTYPDMTNNVGNGRVWQQR
jgi:hypothetical protein